MDQPSQLPGVILRLSAFSGEEGLPICNRTTSEMGAGTFTRHHARALGPHPCGAAYVQPTGAHDRRYAEPETGCSTIPYQASSNPARPTRRTAAAAPCDRARSLRHDFRFVEDDWESRRSAWVWGGRLVRRHGSRPVHLLQQVGGIPVTFPQLR